VLAGASKYSGGSYKHIADAGKTEYFAKMKRGEVCLNGCLILSSNVTCSHYDYTIGPNITWGTRHIVGSVAAEASIDISTKIPGWYGVDVDNAKGRVLIEATAKMKSPDVLLGVFYHEREKTLSMLRRPFGRARELLEDAINRKLHYMRRGYSTLKAFESAWLETRYGWRPTMYDIWGAAKASAHNQPKAGTLLVARAGTELNWKSSEVSTGSYGGPCDRTWQRKTRVNGGVIYTPRDLSAAAWKRRCLGLTLDNIPSTLWEIVPFSFVVDWFVGIGPWLRAATPDPSIHVLGNWVSTVTETTQQTNMQEVSGYVGTPPNHTWYYLWRGQTYLVQDKNLLRECNAPLSLGPLTVETPLSFAKLLDGLFLLHGNVLDKFARLRL
jgi:hypothetical protein